MREINYDGNTRMSHGYPKIVKKRAIRPNGEMTPFVWNGKLMRLELVYDLSNGFHTYSIIVDCEEKKEISRLAEGLLFTSGYLDEDTNTFYCIGTDPENRGRIVGFYSKDLINWESREFINNPGWVYYNTGLTKGPDGYVLLMEASDPVEIVGEKFTHFFATSKDLVNWELMDYDKSMTKERYLGGPWLKYSEGWYYVLACAELPCQRYTNYIYRTQDFETWYVGYYNPVLIADDEDRKLSPNAFGMPQEMIDGLDTFFNINNSDIDMCDYKGKVYLNYLVGNQCTYAHMCEAEYDGTVAELLKSYFE